MSDGSRHTPPEPARPHADRVEPLQTRVDRAAAARSDRWIAAGLGLLTILYLLEARTFRAGFIADPVGPRAFPLLVGAGMLLMAGLLAFRPTDDLPETPDRRQATRMGLAVLALGIYPLLLEPLGYPIATAAVVIALGRLFGGPPAKVLGAAVLLVIGLYLLFSSLLGLYLPALPFQS